MLFVAFLYAPYTVHMLVRLVIKYLLVSILSSTTNNCFCTLMEIFPVYISFLLYFQKADDLWDILDVENSSFLPYAEFMRAFLGEMNETRKAHVIKVGLPVEICSHLV